MYGTKFILIGKAIFFLARIGEKIPILFEFRSLELSLFVFIYQEEYFSSKQKCVINPGIY